MGRFGEIREEAVQRVRRAGLPVVGSGLEAHLLRDVRAVGLPEPAREWPFLWCCPHAKREHATIVADDIPDTPACMACGREDLDGPWVHAYLHERDWRFDFAWRARMVAVEVEGGVWTSGRHTRGAGYSEDCRKYAEAALRGWLVLRVTEELIESGEAIALVERALRVREA